MPFRMKDIDDGVTIYYVASAIMRSTVCCWTIRLITGSRLMLQQESCTKRILGLNHSIWSGNIAHFGSPIAALWNVRKWSITHCIISTKSHIFAHRLQPQSTFTSQVWNARDCGGGGSNSHTLLPFIREIYSLICWQQNSRIASAALLHCECDFFFSTKCNVERIA